MSEIAFQAKMDVSRETLERLKIYERLLRKWNPTINLVSPATLDDLWSRHILDSAQLLRLAPAAKNWADLGSGGGFPGLVVAILRAHEPLDMTLVESDGRKATFLRTVLRETGLEAGVRAERIEAVEPLSASVISARALSPLVRLLGFASRHIAPDGLALFPKGASWKEEVDAARLEWRFELETSPSITDPQSVVLMVKGITRA